MSKALADQATELASRDFHPSLLFSPQSSDWSHCESESPLPPFPPSPQAPARPLWPSASACCLSPWAFCPPPRCAAAPPRIDPQYIRCKPTDILQIHSSPLTDCLLPVAHKCTAAPPQIHNRSTVDPLHICCIFTQHCDWLLLTLHTSGAQVHCCSASDFVTGWANQSGGKTRDMFNKAVGGVLFIDEAYRWQCGCCGEGSFQLRLRGPWQNIQFTEALSFFCGSETNVNPAG